MIGAVSPDLVVVELPAGIPPGDYKLTLFEGKHAAEHDLTIGAVGPAGPQGPAGAVGPQGPMGALKRMS